MDRDGFVMGEGAGIVVLETYEHAKSRGARIYAELIGYGLSGDAHHITAPAEDGDGAFRCMTAAIKRAGISPAEIDYINAHGTSTPLGDEIELGAVHRLVGNAAGRVCMSSTKSSIGHLLGAAGAVEAIFSILAMRDGVAPPTINLDNPSVETPIDLVPHHSKKRDIDVALSNSSDSVVPTPHWCSAGSPMMVAGAKGSYLSPYSPLTPMLKGRFWLAERDLSLIKMSCRSYDEAQGAMPSHPTWVVIMVGVEGAVSAVNSGNTPPGNDGRSGPGRGPSMPGRPVGVSEPTRQKTSTNRTVDPALGGGQIASPHWFGLAIPALVAVDRASLAASQPTLRRLHQGRMLDARVVTGTASR